MLYNYSLKVIILLIGISIFVLFRVFCDSIYFFYCIHRIFFINISYKATYSEDCNHWQRHWSISSLRISREIFVNGINTFSQMESITWYLFGRDKTNSTYIERLASGIGSWPPKHRTSIQRFSEVRNVIGMFAVVVSSKFIQYIVLVIKTE